MKLVLCAAALASCGAGTVFRGGGPAKIGFEVAAPRNRVFDAALVVAQEKNMNVAVLEKSSGLLRLEIARVQPIDLDIYCEYVEVSAETGEAVSTFDAMGIGGVVSMTILLTEKSPTSTNVDLRANWTGLPLVVPLLSLEGRQEPVGLESKKVFEGAFKQRLLEIVNSAPG